MSTERTDHRTSDITVAAWVREHVGPYVLKTASEPEPVLHDDNLIAVGSSPDRIRELVLAWERIDALDTHVGFTAFGHEPVATSPHDVERADDEFDPSHELGHASSRAHVGIAAGAVVGAVVITLITAIFVGFSPVLIGAAIGGAAFGGVAGGMINFTTKTGWSAAYQDSFVDEADTEIAVASLHSADAGTIEAGLAAGLDDDDGSDTIKIYRVGRDGHPTP
ncbi:MAG: hypothetical protein CL424_15475 [Acidimicrobiaceae bacterium]|nr:hypothetical protein [Acidimicrobiaceae bacterium]